jgi:hypothetical protein
MMAIMDISVPVIQVYVSDTLLLSKICASKKYFKIITENYMRHTFVGKHFIKIKQELALE